MLSEINRYLSRLAVIIIVGLTAFCFYQHRLLKLMNANLGRVTNNYRVYENLNSKLRNNNSTLQLKVSELSHSNDSLLLYADSIKKKLKVKDKNLLLVQVINTVVRDTITKVIDKLINFKEILKLNPLTTITVERQDSILSAVIDLKNLLTLFVEEKKLYRNHYKSWLQRFFHFDFKKDRIRKYQIHNSNELIKVTDTRVVEVTD